MLPSHVYWGNSDKGSDTGTRCQSVYQQRLQQGYLGTSQSTIFLGTWQLGSIHQWWGVSCLRVSSTCAYKTPPSKSLLHFAMFLSSTFYHPNLFSVWYFCLTWPHITHKYNKRTVRKPPGRKLHQACCHQLNVGDKRNIRQVLYKYCTILHCIVFYNLQY